MSTRYECSTCEVVHDTLDAAMDCCNGIGSIQYVITSNHWYVNGEGYDSLLDACEEAMFEHTVVRDDDDKVVADYTGVSHGQ